MAVQQLVMPKLGLTMTEGTVLEWHVAEGSTFKRGDILVVVESDKVANEVEAPEDGRLLKIIVAAGATAEAATPIAECTPDVEVGAAANVVHAAPPPAVVAPQTVVAPVGPRRRRATATEATIARRLTEAKQTIPHFYLATEIDAGPMQALRARWKASNPQDGLTVTHLIVMALARTLAAHPELNVVWEGDEFVELERVDIGIAVHVPSGLVVPMLRAADRLDIAGIARSVSALAERARASELTAEDFGGGAVSVSNAGMHDVTYMSSIINPGQAAILGVGSERSSFRPGKDGSPTLV
ncbi:MAG TPA: 2-oxo acid dehydrogenase subunit E2, partial [Rhodocyclaceae bacterium]|nr:2-oxo acid dehydrogenase subunit E2 [Rhodocyclaceae bacterium]